jgi:hypothetical protein
MVERICPHCQHGNPLNNRFCGQCGVPLDTRLDDQYALPAAASTSSNLDIRRAGLPAEWQAMGKTVAISLAALAAEAGMAWLRQRVERMKQQPAAPVAAPTQQLAPTTQQPQPAPHSSDSVTIWSQRVLEVWEEGALTGQVVERHIWRRERDS